MPAVPDMCMRVASVRRSISGGWFNGKARDALRGLCQEFQTFGSWDDEMRDVCFENASDICNEVDQRRMVQGGIPLCEGDSGRIVPAVADIRISKR